MKKLLIAVMIVFAVYSAQAAKETNPNKSIENMIAAKMSEMQNCGKLSTAFEKSRMNFEKAQDALKKTEKSNPWEIKNAALALFSDSIKLMSSPACLGIEKSHITKWLHSSAQRLAYDYPEDYPLFKKIRENTYQIDKSAKELEAHIAPFPGTLEFEQHAKENAALLKEYITEITRLTEDFINKK